MIKATCKIKGDFYPRDSLSGKKLQIRWPTEFIVLPSVGHKVEGIVLSEGYDDPYPMTMIVYAILHKVGHISETLCDTVPLIVIELLPEK